MPVNPIPEGFHAVTPHLIIKNASEAIDFYKRAFGAEELVRMPGPDGKLMHAEIRIGGSPLMIADENPAWGCFGPTGSSPVTIHLYVRDTDAVVASAEKAGATVLMPAQDMFWGDRFAKIQDPFGHQWSIGTHKEDVSPEEMGRRAAAMGS